MEALKVRPGRRVRLAALDPADTSAFHGPKKRALADSEKLAAKLGSLQELLYAVHGPSVLVVLQGLDTAGKDGTIRHVFDAVNPQGVRVASFKIPTPIERDHDFLWRVHAHTPGRGEITIFNRSHYEDVLAARVHHLVPKHVWKARYRSINAFERNLTHEGTIVIKFLLHISLAEQRRRLEARLADPTKHWKFSAGDLAERPLAPEYEAAFEEMLSKTSTPWAPWYVVPSDKKWFRDWAISSILVEAVERLDLTWPSLPPEFKSVRIPP
jgi:PPK2 family polyphosphate:nucleotide phosphotransferase